MRVFRSLEEASGHFGPAAITIGNFDGVHAGHKELMVRTRDLAAKCNARSSVVTFHPHPAFIVAPERVPKLLTTPEARCALIEQEGIDQVLVLPFDAVLSLLTPEEFVHDVLRETLDVRCIVVGDNFHFGHNQSGDIRTLRRLGHQLGFETDIVPAVSRRGRVVSSSEVRKLIQQGRIGLANRLLERCYALEGKVVRGEGRGAKQTVPTLNLATSAEVVPGNGVYITRTTDLDDARTWPSITNAGKRPTFDGVHVTIETFLLAPLTGPPPRRIRLEFGRRVRDEKRFESAEDLKAQIFKDVGRAHTWFRRTAALWSGESENRQP